MWVLTQNGEMLNLASAAGISTRDGKVLARYAGEPRDLVIAEYEEPGADAKAAETFEAVRCALMLEEVYWEWRPPSEPGDPSGLSFLQPRDPELLQN